MELDLQPLIKDIGESIQSHLKKILSPHANVINTAGKFINELKELSIVKAIIEENEKLTQQLSSQETNTDIDTSDLLVKVKEYEDKISLYELKLNEQKEKYDKLRNINFDQELLQEEYNSLKNDYDILSKKTALQTNSFNIRIKELEDKLNS